MRILHLVHQYPPEHVGGTELYTRLVSQALARRDHQVSVFYRRSSEGVGQESRAEGDVQVWAAWNGRLSPARRFLVTFGDPPIARAFERILDEISPDLIHIQHLMGLPVTLLRPVQERKLPFVVTLHDYWWVCPNAQLLTNYSQQVCDGPRAYLNCARCTLARAAHPRLWLAAPALSLLLAWRNRLLRKVLSQADGLIAPTPFVRHWYVAHGALPERLSVIPHGIERLIFEFPQRRGADAAIRFAYVGGLSWQKGVHVLVEAFRGIRDAAELWIGGDESFDPAYASRLRAQASPRVRFLGKLARKQVWDTLAQVDVVVVPSLWYETFSLIVHEAFAAGVPVIASRLGALADGVRDGVNGLLLPPGDVAAWQAALQRLVDRPGLLASLRANIQPPVTLEEHVDLLEFLYTQLVDRNP